MCNFLLTAWARVSKEMIIKSFDCCGLSVGCTPDDISCMKIGKPAHEALEEVKSIWNEPLEEIEDIGTQETHDEAQEQEENENEIFIGNSSDDEDE